MIAGKLKTDPAVAQILEVLNREYSKRHPQARIDAYRYSPSEIRVRIIDPDVARIRITRRSDPVDKIIRDHLPESVRQDIWFLIVLAPDELDSSAMNMEFENPTSFDP